MIVITLHDIMEVAVILFFVALFIGIAAVAYLPAVWQGVKEFFKRLWKGEQV